MVCIEIFVDGSWLYQVCRHLKKQYGYKFDYSQIPTLVRSHLMRHGFTGNICNIYYLCSYHPNSHYASNEQRLYRALEWMGFKVIRFSARRTANGFCEKKVDVALTAWMMSRSISDDAFDVGVLISGDSDYVPMLDFLNQRQKKLLLVGYEDNVQGYYPTSRELMQDNSFTIPTLLINENIDELCIAA